MNSILHQEIINSESLRVQISMLQNTLNEKIDSLKLRDYLQKLSQKTQMGEIDLLMLLQENKQNLDNYFSLNQKLQSQQSKIKEQQDLINKLQLDNNDLLKYIDNLSSQKEYDQLQEELRVKDQKIQEQEQEIQLFMKTIQNLQDNLQKYSINMDKLSKENQKLGQQQNIKISESGINNELNQQIEKINKNVNNQQLQIEQLQKQISEKDLEIYKLKQQIQQLNKTSINCNQNLQISDHKLTQQQHKQENDQFIKDPQILHLKEQIQKANLQNHELIQIITNQQQQNNWKQQNQQEQNSKINCSDSNQNLNDNTIIIEYYKKFIFSNEAIDLLIQFQDLQQKIFSLKSNKNQSNQKSLQNKSMIILNEIQDLSKQENKKYELLQEIAIKYQKKENSLIMQRH